MMSGSKDMKYDITLPDSVVLYDLQDSTKTITVTHLAPSTRHYRLDDHGKQTIFVGGLLNVGKKQAAGDYAGILRLTMIYYREPKIIFVD